MKMRSCNFCHTNTKNPENNLGIFCLITGRPKLNGYGKYPSNDGLQVDIQGLIEYQVQICGY